MPKSVKGERPVTEVVAALITDDQGRLLICQRPSHKARGLLWEFPGGKVDPGETHEQALIRECQEELAVTLRVGRRYTGVTHAYPDLTVRLSFYTAAVIKGEPQALEHADIRWVLPEELDQFDFCPADTGMIAGLAAENKRDFRKLRLISILSSIHTCCQSEKH